MALSPTGRYRINVTGARGGVTTEFTDQLNAAVSSAQASAVLSGRYANDATDTPIPGASSTTLRGSKYWSIVANGFANAASATVGGLSTALLLVPSFARSVARTSPAPQPIIKYGMARTYTLDGASAPSANLSSFTFVDSTRLFANEGWVDGVKAFFLTAVPSRTVWIEICRPSTGNVVFVSDALPMPLAGTNSVTLTLDKSFVALTGDVFAIVCSHGGGDGIAYDSEATINTLRPTDNSNAPRSVGASYTANTIAQSNIAPRVSWSAVSTGFVVTTDTYDVAGGVAGLDIAGKIKSRILPMWLDKAGVRNAANTSLSIRRRTSRSTVAKVVGPNQPPVLNQLSSMADANGDGGSYSSLPRTISRISMSWLSTAGQPGIPANSRLLRLLLPPPTDVAPGGGTIQVWLFRPRTPLAGIALNTRLDLDCIGALNEFAVSANWPSDRFIDLPIPRDAQAGDLIGIQGVNVGIMFAAGESLTNDYYIDISEIADKTISGPLQGVTGIVKSGQRVAMQVTYATDTLAGMAEGANAFIMSDAAGDIPAHVGRKSDMPWRDQVIIATGTSQEIRDAIDATKPYNNHVYQMFEAMQCIGYNSAEGGTRFGVGSISSLGATKAELNAFPGGGSAYEQYSYEAKVIDRVMANAGKAILWLDLHGFNDAPFTTTTGESGKLPLGTIDDAPGTGSYFAVKKRAYDAFLNACRTNGCRARLMFATCTHQFNGDTTINPWWETINVANRTLAKWYSAPIFELMAITGINPTTIRVGSPISGGSYPNGIISDAVHVRQAAYDNIAPALITAVKSC